MRVFARKDVVDEVFDPRLEISVEEARKSIQTIRLTMW